MKKTFFGLALSAMLLALCLPAGAQQPTKVPRIGYLGGVSFSANTARHEAFRQGLRELGYVGGKNIVIDWRSADGKLDRLPALAAELSRLKVDVIVTTGSSATRRATGRPLHGSKIQSRHAGKLRDQMIGEGYTLCLKTCVAISI